MKIAGVNVLSLINKSDSELMEIIGELLLKEGTESVVIYRKNGKVKLEKNCFDINKELEKLFLENEKLKTLITQIKHEWKQIQTP